MALLQWGLQKKKVDLQDDDSAESESVDDSEDGNLDEDGAGDIDQQVGQEGDEDLALPSDDVTQDTTQAKADKPVQPAAAQTPAATPKPQGVFSGAMAKIKSLKFW